MFSEFSMRNLEGIYEVDETKVPKKPVSLMLDMINNGYLPSNVEVAKLGEETLFEMNKRILRERSAI